MTDVPTPDQTPSARERRGQLVMLIILVAVLGTPIVFLWMSSRSDNPEPSLCDLLRSGWTADEIVDSDQWRDWPANMSHMQRSVEVILEAEQQGCPELVGL